MSQIASNRSNQPKAGPEYRSGLRTGRPRNRVGIPATEDIFWSAERSDRLWGPPNLMCSVYTSGAFPKGNTDRSHPSCYDVQNVTVHLLLYIFAWLSSIRWQILKPWAQEKYLVLQKVIFIAGFSWTLRREGILGSGRLVPWILSSYWVEIGLTPQPHYDRVKSLRYPLDRRLPFVAGKFVLHVQVLATVFGHWK